jgi:hypothetical protein
MPDTGRFDASGDATPSYPNAGAIFPPLSGNIIDIS